jgi:hypothetical protein
MKQRVLVDFHHSSLLRSLVMLFEDRLDMELYRPIGMEWYHEGYWAINDNEKTAEQFLGMHQGYYPADGTPRLNVIHKDIDRIGPEDHDKADTLFVIDPGRLSYHKAARLKFFQENKFDFVVASIPAHVPVFKKLIAEYNPAAKLIIQMGNNWDMWQYAGENVLASIAPQMTPANAIFYHQEFDLDIFAPAPIPEEKTIYSFINVMREYPQAQRDYDQCRRLLGEFKWGSFGGQNPDGNLTGPKDLAQKMAEAMFVFHSKPGGDGFGHIIHNAFAMGRIVIARSSQYQNQLAADLLVPGTFVDMDKYSRGELKNIIRRISYDRDVMRSMSERAAARFREVVNYENESKEIELWLQKIQNDSSK